MSVFRIAKWEQVFERAESRKLKTLTWVAMPVGFSSHGYQSLLDEFGDQAAGVYGAWCALVSVAAGCPRRGILCSGKGIPISTDRLARMTGLDKSIFDMLLEWGARSDIGWLEVLSDEDLAAIVKKNDSKTSEIQASGDSPDDPPMIPRQSPGTSGDRRGNPPTTQPNPTQPNPTISNPTQPADADRMEGWLKKDDEFRGKVVHIANRIRKARPALDRLLVWQVAFVSVEFDEMVGSDIADRLRSGGVRDTKKYIDAAMRNLCELNGEKWDRLRVLVPNPPPDKEMPPERSVRHSRGSKRMKTVSELMGNA